MRQPIFLSSKNSSVIRTPNAITSTITQPVMTTAIPLVTTFASVLSKATFRHPSGTVHKTRHHKPVVASSLDSTQSRVILPYIDCCCFAPDQCGPPFGTSADDPRMDSSYPRIYSEHCFWPNGKPVDTYLDRASIVRSRC